jgi:hypothetical protein
MTEPSEPTDPESLPPEPAPTPTDPATTPAWIPPDGGGSGSGRRRWCVIAAIGVVVLLVLGYIGLIFLGSQVESILNGTIEFGTGGTGCSVSGKATTFPASASIHAVAYLERDTTVGETLTLAVTYPDATTETNGQAVASVANCVSQDIQSGLAPGHYRFEYRAGTEVLAQGGFDITP